MYNYTESPLNSSNDEKEASPMTGWEVALFAEPESSNVDNNVVAVNEEVGLILCHFTCMYNISTIQSNYIGGS